MEYQIHMKKYIPYKISIITACFNSSKSIASNIESILSQEYNNIEHIIIDNISYDDTIKIIESYKKEYEKKNINLVISSKKDNGIYYAMNDGIKLSKGDIIGFLNSDDYFATNNVTSLIVWGFNKPTKPKIIYANIDYINNKNKIVRTLKGMQNSTNAFKLGFHPAHPSFYVKKDIYKEYGKFNTKYKIASDYEIMLRFLVKYKLDSLYINDCFVKMKLGGVSNANIKNIIKANIECANSWRDNKLSNFPLFIIFKILSKVKNLIATYYSNRWGGVKHKHYLFLLEKIHLLQTPYSTHYINNGYNI